MGTCFSKKGISTTSPNAITKPISSSSQKQNSVNEITVPLTKPETTTLKQKKSAVQEKQQDQEDETQVKKEVFIIKHRKSHDDRERSLKISSFNAQHNVQLQNTNGSDSSSSSSSVAVTATSESTETNNKGVVGVRTSSCTKEEVDAILIQCGRLSRSSSGIAASSSGVKKYSGSKRSFDFDHCDNENDTISAEDDQKRSDNSEEYDGRRRRTPRPSSPSSERRRRRTPSRERENQQHQQRSSSRERRVSRSPGRRSSETTANASSGSGSSSRLVKLVSVPATVTSLVMDKSNNVGAGDKRISVKKNGGDNNGMVGSRGALSPRSQSPARGKSPARAKSPARTKSPARVNGKVLSENQQQQQLSLSRNNSGRKAEQSPYRRNPLSEVDPNSLAYPQSNINNGSSKVQNKLKKEIEVDASIQKPNVVKGMSTNCNAKEQEEDEIKVMSSIPDNAVVKTILMPSMIDNNLKPQTITRSRSSRRSRDLDINPESLTNPPFTYTSLLLEDIHNFHQKNTQQPSISLPACLTKVSSILDAVADLNSTTTSNTKQHHPFVESEVIVSDDLMEPSLHKYVTVKRGGSLDMDDQESSGSNSFTVSSGQQQHWGGISSSSWEPNSADSLDSWNSRLNSKEEGKKSGLSSEAKKRECDHQHSGGIGRGRLSSNKSVISLPDVVAAAAST